METNIEKVKEKKIRLFILEGLHGCGKTTLIERFSDSDKVKIKKENFTEVSLAFQKFSPQSFITETMRLSARIEDIANLVHECRKDGIHNILADRSLLSGGIYVIDPPCFFHPEGEGKLFMKMAIKLQDQLEKELNLCIEIIKLETSKEILLERIKSRLIKEPERLLFNEDDPKRIDDLIFNYDKRYPFL